MTFAGFATFARIRTPWPHCRCGRYVEPYMAHDHVWVDEASLPKKNCLVCLSCLELTLGRVVTIEDFTDAVVNDGVRFGYMLGRRP